MKDTATILEEGIRVSKDLDSLKKGINDRGEINWSKGKILH